MTRRLWNRHWMPSVSPVVVVVLASVPILSSPTVATATSVAATRCESVASRTSFQSAATSGNVVCVVRVVVPSSTEPYIGSATGSNGRSVGSSSSAALLRDTRNVPGTTMPSSSSELSWSGSGICQTPPSASSKRPSIRSKSTGSRRTMAPDALIASETAAATAAPAPDPTPAPAMAIFRVSG